MMTAQQVIDLLQTQVGVHEGYSNGHWNNMQPYSSQVPGLEWSQGQAWCSTLQAWADVKTGLAGPNTASCAAGVAWFKARNRFSEYPAIGAYCFFGPGGGTHVGRVYNFDDTYVYTIEGNTNVNGSPEGDGVYRKKHARRDSYVYGYGYPLYDGGILSADPAWAAQNPGATPSVPAGSPILKPTVSLSAVRAAIAQDRKPSSPTGTVHYGDPTAPRALEQALWDKGINCGPVDGSLGTMFVAGYAAWQRACGYRGKDADGIPGLQTLTRLGQETGRFIVTS